MRRRPGGLHLAALLLAVVSTVAVLGASLAAAVVQAGSGVPAGGSGTLVRHGAGPGKFDYSGWFMVKGDPGASGDRAVYRVPGGWEAESAQEPVEYADAQGKVLASGHATSFYYGNDCSEGKKRIPGGWVAFADTDDRASAGDDLVSTAEAAVRAWGRGYGTNAQGTTGPMTAFSGESLTLPDGASAGRARMEIDMTGFGGACLPETAEIMVTSIKTGDGVKSLVQARYLLEKAGISEEDWDGIAGSFAQPTS